MNDDYCWDTQWCLDKVLGVLPVQNPLMCGCEIHTMNVCEFRIDAISGDNLAYGHLPYVNTEHSQFSWYAFIERWRNPSMAITSRCRRKTLKNKPKRFRRIERANKRDRRSKKKRWNNNISDGKKSSCRAMLVNTLTWFHIDVRRGMAARRQNQPAGI